MAKLTDYTRYADAQQHFSQAGLWDLFDGAREWLNIGHECIDRHAGGERIAVRIAHADGRDEALAFRDLAASSSQFAHYLADRGVKVGDRVAIMLEPSLAFYVALFGTAKLGAIAVPLFTLFGPDGIRLRITHHLTNWMGDERFLRRAQCKIRRHNPEGDYLLIDGTVTRKFIEDGRHLVEINQSAHNQDSEVSVVGSGVVELWVHG
jgi:AMP-binding enzyme